MWYWIGVVSINMFSKKVLKCRNEEISNYDRQENQVNLITWNDAATYLLVISPPGSKKTCCLIFADADQEGTFRIPDNVFNTLKVTANCDRRFP